MRTSHELARCALLLSLFAAAQSALADAECYKGYRNTTAAERTKMTWVLETIRSALPAPAAGWVITGDDAIDVPQSLCQDVGLVPIVYGFSRSYANVGDAAQRQKLFEDRAAIDAEAAKKKQPRLDAIQAQIEAVVAKQVSLVEKGDYTGAQKYNAESERLQAEYQRVADEGSDPAAMDALAKKTGQDIEMTIHVVVNPQTVRTPDEARPVAPPAGAKSAFRWHVETTTESNDHALYYFGTLFRRPDGTFQPSVRQGAPFSAAHAITLSVKADPGRMADTLAAIDFAKVASALR